MQLEYFNGTWRNNVSLSDMPLTPNQLSLLEDSSKTPLWEEVAKTFGELLIKNTSDDLRIPRYVEGCGQGAIRLPVSIPGETHVDWRPSKRARVLPGKNMAAAHAYTNRNEM